jgi:hypothetical protein
MQDKEARHRGSAKAEEQRNRAEDKREVAEDQRSFAEEVREDLVSFPGWWV